MTILFSTEELRKEKQTHPDWVFFLGDKEKNPQTIVGKWRDITKQSIQELEDLIERTQQRKDVEAWNWGIRTGIKDIACLDFDWEFIYYRWLRKFGDRAKTTTYRTANKGYRVIFKTIETENDNPYKNNLHTEFENKGYAVIGGFAEDVDGQKQPYQKLSQTSLYQKVFSIPNTITRDNTLIADTKKWLSKQLERYDFLQYKCVQNIVDRKHIKLTHDQRLAILHFMILKKFKDAEIHDFFSTVYDDKGRDYKQHITESQIQSGKDYLKKGYGKPHPCEPKTHENGHVSVPLYQVFNFNSSQCKTCIRKLKKETVKKTIIEPEMGFSLEYLNNKFLFKVPIDTEEILGYKDGCYEPFDHIIKHELEELYGEELKRNFVEENLAHIQRANFIEREKINRFANKIPIQNGVYNFVTHDVEPFDSEEVITFKLNVFYDSSKKSEKWENFVSEILPDENDRKFLQEVMGYCLLPAMPLHKLFWFYGIGRNGKDRVILTLEFILDPENVSHLNLGEFRENRRFSLCQLYGKLLNVSSEPESKYPISTNILKMISGENTIHAELKGRNKRLIFTNKAKPIIVGNSFPKVTDTSIGFWDRVEVLNFPRSFTGDDCIPNIERTWLDDPDEVSGIFNWMLKGLYRLQENKQFTSSKTTKETKAEFMRVSDPFNAWLMDLCKIIPNAYLTRQEAYDSYKNYAFELGAEPDSSRTFYSNMRRTPRIKDTQIKIEKKPVRVFQGITLKTDLEKEKGQKKLDEKVAEVTKVASTTSQEYTEENKKKVEENITPVTSATSATISEKYEQIIQWIRENNNSKGLVSSSELNKMIRILGLEPTKINVKLLREGVIFDVKTLGAWGVAI